MKGQCCNTCVEATKYCLDLWVSHAILASKRKHGFVFGWFMQYLHQATRYHLDLWVNHAIPTSKRKNLTGLWVVGAIPKINTRNIYIDMKKKKK